MLRWIWGMWIGPAATSEAAARTRENFPAAELASFVVVVTSVLLLIRLVPEHGWATSLTQLIFVVLLTGFIIFLQVALTTAAARQNGWETNMSGVLPAYALSMVAPLTASLVEAALYYLGYEGLELYLVLAGGIWSWYLLVVALRAFGQMETPRAVSCALPVVFTDLLYLSLPFIFPVGQ